MIEARYPLRFRRRILPKVWGARRLEALFGVEGPPGAAVGESWELSDHPSGESVVANGPLEGVSLRALVESQGHALLGGVPLGYGGRFPWLVKFVDTADRLSVQVHPDDPAAARLGEMDGGKNEAWYVVHADPGARLWVGLADGKRREDLEAARTPREFEACLRSLTPRPGDAVAIPAGTVHAIGPGLTLCEVQQTSDITYRLYDWDRPASVARPLHRNEALAVARFDARPLLTTAAGLEPDARQLASVELPSPGSFRWHRCRARGSFDIPSGAGARVFVLLLGSLELRSEAEPRIPARAVAGEAVLLPAAAGSVRASGAAEYLCVESCP